MAFAIKAEISDPRAKAIVFAAQKTMYEGKHIAEGVVGISGETALFLSTFF